MAEDEMVEWHHQHHRCESEQAPGIILPTKVHTAKAVILEKTLKMALKHVKYHV